MKIKATPGDFVVQEESEVAVSEERAEYAIFRLAKTSWDTFDLIDLLSRKWGVSRGDISVGGIKTINHVDYEFSNILGVISEFTTVVYGD